MKQRIQRSERNVIASPKEYTAKLLDGGIGFYYQENLTIKCDDEISGLCMKINLLANGWKVSGPD
ncbi:MAG: hypothetical protein ACRC62_19925 [Microcoleus sp.]